MPLKDCNGVSWDSLDTGCICPMPVLDKHVIYGRESFMFQYGSCQAGYKIPVL